MDMDYIIIQFKINMKENRKKIKKKDKEYIIIQIEYIILQMKYVIIHMEINMKENGKMI